MRYWFSRIWSHSKSRSVLFTLAAMMGAYVFLPESMPEAARRVSVVFVMAVFFWALEVIPLYATSLMVVLLQTFLLCRPGGVLGLDQGGYKMFMMTFGNPVIMLFFGGFVLAAAMQKYYIDRLIASHLLKVFGRKPFMILLGFIMCTGFLSMWMSNTATAALMMAMVLPLLNRLDESDPFRTALVLAIPFAANIGGIGTPVGTPPNAIALGILAKQNIHLSFIAWMKMAVPLALLLLGMVTCILYKMFPPRKREVELNITQEHRMDGKFWLVVLIAIITVSLWLTSDFHKIPAELTALLAAGLLAATSVLNVEDFRKIEWEVLILMWGGLALSDGMEVSGLTKWVVGLPVFEQHGFFLFAVFCLMAVGLSTFMSNTAAANLMIPIAVGIPGESSVMLAVTVALSVSFAMALPISTPPNAIAFSTKMVTSREMLKAGLLISILATAIVLLGFKFVLVRAFSLP